jgi:hypothetical protein
LKGYKKTTLKMQNKKAATNGWLWIVVIVGIVLLINAQPAFLSNLLGKDSTSTDGSSVPPADKQQTITLNTKNALSTSDINANVSYYVFSDDGKFVKSGTTATGTASFTVNYGASYKILAYTDGTYYPQERSFVADGNGAAQQTINLGLNPVSNATINKVRNPVDLSANITVGVGKTVDFDVLYAPTSSSSAINSPVIVFDVNQTSVSDVTLGTKTKIPCPIRLTTSAQRKKICYQDTTLLSTDSLRVVSGKIVFSGTTTPGTTDGMTVTIIDTQKYADPNFAIKGYDAFHDGTENLNTNLDVGAADSISYFLEFAGA